MTDVALVTSLRDGMNLVSYEYVACQSENAGVVAFVLSVSHCQHAWPGNFGVAAHVRRPGCTFTSALSAQLSPAQHQLETAAACGSADWIPPSNLEIGGVPPIEYVRSAADNSLYNY